MPIEFFIVPMIGSGTKEDPIRPRYVPVTGDEFGGAFGVPTKGGGSVYSDDSVALGWCEAPQAYLDQVAIQPDAHRLCTYAAITDNIGGQGNTFIRNLLESLNIPANWTSAADSWRQTIRVIVNMFQFTQRHQGLNGSGFFTDLEVAGFGLNTQWQNLSPEFQATIQATIDDLGWTLVPQPTQQVRELLKQFADQYQGLVYETSIGPI